MEVSIHDCLPSDAVNFVPDLPSDGTRRTLCRDPKHGSVFVTKLQFDVLKRLSQIIVFDVLESQSPQCHPAFLCYMSQGRQHALHKTFER